MKFLFSVLIFISTYFCTTFLYRPFHPVSFETISLSELAGDGIWKKKKVTQRSMNPSAIVIHTTEGLSARDYVKNSIEEEWLIHYLITKNGSIYSISKDENLEVKAVPKMDSFSLHIALEGNESEILENKQQIELTASLLKELSGSLAIELNNKDIASGKGIFTHTQAKKRYGNFVDSSNCGSEKVLTLLLDKIGGTYYPETEWTDRYEKIWTMRKEKRSEIKPDEFDRGRGITPRPATALVNVEKEEDGLLPENFRLKYKFKPSVQRSCVVLHFTAISSFKISQDTLEIRRLSASIMVDKDAKAYQLLDTLEDQAFAATGTNDSCVQIEIVGKNTDELLANEKQTQIVVALVKELSDKYKIPLTNQKIESLSGIFSHTQAKKKFGGSIALAGKDFDPGEEYMRKVLTLAGGTYYPEEEWFERKSDNWIMLYKNFQP